MQLEAIKTFSDQLASRFSPERVILFGSHAKGLQRPDSDVDLLVILQHEKRNVDKAIEILQTLDVRFAIDLLVRTPEDVEKRLSMNDFFMQDILKEGVVLYETAY